MHRIIYNYKIILSWGHAYISVEIRLLVIYYLHVQCLLSEKIQPCVLRASKKKPSPKALKAESR